MEKQELMKIVFYGILIFAIIFSSFIRFDDPLVNIPNNDEFYNFIAAIKLNIDHDFYDPRLYNYEHPFYGKKLMGAFIDKTQEYPNIALIPINLYYLNYLAAEEIKDQEESMRFMAIFFGLLALIPVFLIGKELFDTITGLFSTTLVALSIGFINLSRVPFQDAFLPFFFFFAIYFGILYVKSDENEKIRKFNKSIIYLLLTSIFIFFSAIIRLGQPIFLVAALIIALILKKNKKHIFSFIFILPLLVISTLFFYGLDAFNLMLNLRAENLVPFEFTLEPLIGMISHNSFTFLILLIISIFYLFIFLKPRKQKTIFEEAFSLKDLRNKFNLTSTNTTLDFINRNYEVEKRKDLYALKEKTSQPIERKIFNSFKHMEIDKKFMLISFIFILFGIFLTGTGSSPRFYIIFLIFPILFVSGFISKFKKPFFYIGISLIILIDIMLLWNVSPNFIDYSVMDLQPKYLSYPAEGFKNLDLFLEQNNYENFITNDAAIILRHGKGTAMPPIYKRFKESANCTLEYFQKMKGTLLVYRKEFTIENNKFICVLFKHNNLILLDEISINGSIFELYEIGEETLVEPGRN